MSLGGGKSQSTTDTRLLGMGVNSATYGNAIPLGYGQNRIPMFLLQYVNFVATPHTTTQSGGKGGGGGSSNTTFTYSASPVMGLCEGPITGIGQVWQDKAITSLAALGFTLFSGAGGQATWSYMTTNFPAQAIPYDHTAYVAKANYSLGSSAALPNLTFEVTGFLPYNAGTINDAEPSAFLLDYCTDANHGANFPFLSAGIQGAGVLTYQSYCIAMGLLLSPFELTQRPANQFIKEILEITNSGAVWSAGVLNINPYADVSVTGNGRTYTPNLTPQFAFTDDDYMPSSSGGDPLIVKRIPTSDTYNVVRVEYLDRTNAYNVAIAESSDARDIALNGVRVMATLTYHSITTAPVARQVAQLILQRQLYIRNTFVFSVRADYCLLEPMDLVSITDSALGIFNKLVRITEVQDDEHDQLTLTAEDMLVGTASAPLYNWQLAQGYAANYNTAPPSVASPLIFAAPPLLVSAAGGYEMWIAIDQAAAGSWGGCDVYMSLDGTSYIFAGTINGAARYGSLTASLANHTDPDTADTLSLALTNAAATTLQILSGSAADYNNLRTLMYVDGEIIAYQTATLTGAGNYNLTTLRRGQYGSVASLHATSSLFARIDSAIFRVPFDVGMMGQTVHFKFCSFNIYGHAYQSLGSVTDYTHVLSNNNAGQNMPGALTLIGVGVTTASNTAFKSAQTSVWDSSVYSAQSYTNGCTVECFASQLTAQVMLGLTLNPSASNSYTNLAYAWYITNAGTLDIYESGASRGFTGTYTTSDLFAITYDGKHIVYYHNGAIVRSVPITGLTLFLQICFCELGGAVYGIEFSSQAPVSIPLTLLNFNGNSACVGTTAKKVGGTNGAWDTAAYSSQAYTNGCSLSCTQVAPLGADMMGLTLNPTASVSYTNLAYAFYMAGGTWNIYESGALALGGSTYTGATMFEIIHDGKHVAYYVAGSLVRSVPVSTTAFYMQICLGGVGDVVNNINWGPVATAVTPYTLVPMSANVACAGTRAVSTAGSGAFGTKNFQSKECYTGGATVSASVSQLTGALFVGFSTAPATGAAGGYGPVLAAWYPHGDSSICEIIFNNASLGSVGATPTLADVFTVTFDNFNFYWYRNNTLVLQMPYPYAGPLYLFGDFYGAGYGFSNIAFLPYSSSTPQAFIARGNHVVSDTSVSKSVNDGLWTSGDAYSINGYPTCHVVFKANQSNVALMVALVNLAPPASSNYTGLSYAIFCRADTVIEIYESSVSAGTYGNYTTADYLAITYDGTTLIYSKNGVALLTRTGSVGPLFADVDSSGAGGINSLEWGPGATIPLLDTAQVNPNAVTDVVSTTVAGPVNVYTSGTTCTLLGSITVPASNFASTHVVTVTGTVDHHAPGAQFSTCATISTTTLTSFSGSQDTWIARNASTGVPDTGGSWAKEKTFAAAAATAVTYYVYGYSGGVASTGAFANIYNIGIKAEVIKR